jgi:hypothetical protein
LRPGPSREGRLEPEGRPLDLESVLGEEIGAARRRSVRGIGELGLGGPLGGQR